MLPFHDARFLIITGVMEAMVKMNCLSRRCFLVGPWTDNKVFPIEISARSVQLEEYCVFKLGFLKDNSRGIVKKKESARKRV